MIPVNNSGVIMANMVLQNTMNTTTMLLNNQAQQQRAKKQREEEKEKEEYIPKHAKKEEWQQVSF